MIEIGAKCPLFGLWIDKHPISIVFPISEIPNIVVSIFEIGFSILIQSLVVISPPFFNCQFKFAIKIEQFKFKCQPFDAFVLAFKPDNIIIFALLLQLDVFQTFNFKPHGLRMRIRYQIFIVSFSKYFLIYILILYFHLAGQFRIFELEVENFLIIYI